MVHAFITLRVLDIIDILLVAYLMYLIYNIIKGTVAINIFIAIFFFYFLWLIVKALNMTLLGSILGQVIGVGVIAIIIVFQQEIRRFLLLIGTRYFSQKFNFENLFSLNVAQGKEQIRINSVVKAAANMAQTRTGALIVLGRKSSLNMFAETGDILNANTSSRLLETIFAKNSPLHDGAVIIEKDKVYAARCILPVSENIDLPPRYGLRHRAAIGMTENNDSLVVIVSEETGYISVSENGKIKENVSPEELKEILEKEFVPNLQQETNKNNNL